MSLVRFEINDSVGVITLDNPPVNALSGELIADLVEVIERAADPAVRAAVVTGSPRFSAGADITQFQSAMRAGHGGELVGIELGRALLRLEALPKPVVAAVRGYALGGGLELAMACDLRLLADDAKVGQPEIRLGVIPGAGGTQRLPRLVGVGRARDLVYTGRVIGAADALHPDRSREAQQLRLEVLKLRSEDVAGRGLERAVEEDPDRPAVFQGRDRRAPIDQASVEVAAERARAAEDDLLGEGDRAAP